MRFLVADGGATLGLSLQALADLAALDRDRVPDSWGPVWEAARCG